MKKIALLIAIGLTPLGVLAQNGGLGLPSFGSLSGSGFDTVDNQNLNITFSIPLVSSAGRGMPLNLSLTYNSLIWGKGSSWYPVVDASGNQTWGWTKDFPAVQLANYGIVPPSATLKNSISVNSAAGGTVGYTSTTVMIKCTDPGSPILTYDTTYKNFYYVDVLGNAHSFPAISYVVNNDCPSHNRGTYASYANDATGYFLNDSFADPTFSVLTAPDGKTIINGTSGTASDSNGNYITKTVVSSTETDWTDSVGNKALKIIYSPSQTAPTSIQYQFLDGTGTNTYQTITLKLQPYSIRTAFNCGVGEFNGSANLPYELDIPSPNGGTTTLTYTFAYEGTPNNSGYYTGRLLKVTFPTGGSYEYDYPTTAPYGINCTDGTTMNVSRKVTDGANVATWIYARSGTSTTMTTPALGDNPNASDTVYNFSGGQETSRLVYGNSPGTALLRTINTTWASNGTPSTQTTILEDANHTQSEVTTTYDSNGLLDSTTEYDWGQGAPGGAIRQTNYTYQTSTNYTSRNIINLVTSKQITNGLQSTVLYRQDTTYDGVALANCPANVPQHYDATYPCSMNYRGNPTQVTTYLSPNTASNGISQNFTYDWFGNVLQASGGGTPQTNMSFSSATQYAEPDSVSVGGPTTYLTYYSDTGQVKTVKDPNSQITSYAYDFLRRVTSVTRPDNFHVTTAYHDSAPFTSDVTSPVDSTRSVQQITAFDALGLPNTQTLEDSNNNVQSVVQTNYDVAGRSYQTSAPYTTSPQYWTTTAFDALGRASSVTDGGNGTLSYAYAVNDVLQTLGPKPSGDNNTKSRQMEYDGAGRLTSVCELTAAQGSGSCAQKSAQTGFWTTYAYDVLDDLTHVTQHAQASPTETRAYAYDALGRMTSATDPETGTNGNGTVSYTYDSDSTCGTSTGDLVKSVDAAGDVVCTAYDALHRATNRTYPSGPYASVTPQKYFVYDSATVNGQPMGNTSSRLAEAYTCFAPCSSKITDLGVSYTVLGQVSDRYESTPHSGVYYHSAATFWPNGVIEQLNGYSGTQLTYSAGYTLNAAGQISSNSWLSSASYNAAGQATQVNLGSGDSDTFTFDPATARMTQYKYTVNNQSVVGNLTWNANGTLAQLAITDPFDSANNQTCNYAYDDLVRVSSANCGSIMSQTFGYDPFGNVTASGTWSYQPAYSLAGTNHITQIGSSNVTYDGNGNVTNDQILETYSYDADRHAITIAGSGNGLTYDALGQMVEMNLNGTYSDEMYSPAGFLMQYVNSQKKFVPLPGGDQVVYIPGAPGGSGYYYRHADWLGSTRLASTTSRTMYYDLAYAPYGTPYAISGSPDYVFTGMEHTFPSDYDFPAREYSIQGRWPSPDPAGLGAVDLTNPQSWNRYAYVLNNPLSLVDPTGLCDQMSAPGVTVISCTTNPPPSLLAPGAFDNPNDDTFFGGPGAGSYYHGGLCIKINEHILGLSLSQAQQACGVFVPPPQTTPTFTIRGLPSNTQTCSAMLQFNAPPGFDLNKIIAAGNAGGLGQAGAAVGHYGSFDFQRVRDTAGNTTFYAGYTQVSNIAVGAYMYGAGYSEGTANAIANVYGLLTLSSNSLKRNNTVNIDFGYDLAKAGWNPSCKP